MALDREKLKALVLYVIWRTRHYKDFGATKLNKVLWFADARFYRGHGRSITGETYVRQPHGPVPENIETIKLELEDSSQMVAWDEDYFGRVVRRLATVEPPIVDRFTAEELTIVDWWTNHIGLEHTATSVSELSHDYPWTIAKIGEVIPMYAVFAERVRVPNQEELAWATAEAKRLGLQ